MKTKSLEIALYFDARYDILAIKEIKDEEYILTTGYKRISESRTIEFKMFSNEVMLEDEIKRIDAMINKISSDARIKCNELEKTRQELLEKEI